TIGNFVTYLNVYHTLVEHWDGSSWSIVSSPNFGPDANNNGLDSVTCVSASDCWAVGHYYDNAANHRSDFPPVLLQTLIEHWNGTVWTIVPSANTSPRQYNFLYGVTCASASECWAVGSFYNGTNDQTLIERWDGASWTVVSSPNVSTTLGNDLSSVAC